MTKTTTTTSSSTTTTTTTGIWSRTQHYVGKFELAHNQTPPLFLPLHTPSHFSSLLIVVPLSKENKGILTFQSIDVVTVSFLLNNIACWTGSVLIHRNRGFSRRSCWRAETMKQFCMKIDWSYFPEERKCIVFALQHGGNDVTWIYCLHRDIKPREECLTPSGSQWSYVLLWYCSESSCSCCYDDELRNKTPSARFPQVVKHKIVFFSFWSCGFLLIASL